jgi:hypothetical protein
MPGNIRFPGRGSAFGGIKGKDNFRPLMQFGASYPASREGLQFTPFSDGPEGGGA